MSFQSLKVFHLVILSGTNAAFTCYWNYGKYDFPNRKLDVNGLSNRIYYWEIEFPSWAGHKL